MISSVSKKTVDLPTRHTFSAAMSKGLSKLAPPTKRTVPPRPEHSRSTRLETPGGVESPGTNASHPHSVGRSVTAPAGESVTA